MQRIALTIGLLFLLGACDTTRHPSESYYRSSETMRSFGVERCRVLEVREISIGAAERTQQGGRMSFGQPEEHIATLLGAALGAAIGNQVGGGSGQKLAILVGTTAGGAYGRTQGTRISQNRMTRPGLEYSIMTSAGREEVIVQNYNPGDRVARPGSTCRLSGTGIDKRVLPADQLPARIDRPIETRWAD